MDTTKMVVGQDVNLSCGDYRCKGEVVMGVSDPKVKVDHRDRWAELPALESPHVQQPEKPMQSAEA